MSTNTKGLKKLLHESIENIDDEAGHRAVLRQANASEDAQISFEARKTARVGSVG